jgi:hypothetical protein
VLHRVTWSLASLATLQIQTRSVGEAAPQFMIIDHWSDPISYFIYISIPDYIPLITFPSTLFLYLWSIFMIDQHWSLRVDTLNNGRGRAEPLCNPLPLRSRHTVRSHTDLDPIYLQITLSILIYNSIQDHDQTSLDFTFLLLIYLFTFTDQWSVI